MKRIAVVAAALGLLMSPAAAQAHERTIYQGNDKGWVGENHFAIKVTDKECDGNTVRLRYMIDDKYTPIKYIHDKNGCKAGGYFGQAPSGNVVTKIQLCEVNTDTWDYYCTSWKNV